MTRANCYRLVLWAISLALVATLGQAWADEAGAPCTTCEPAAAPPAPPLPNFGGCCWTREKLTGDWDGWRTDLACNGITLDADETLFFGGIASGGLGQQFNTAGHGDYVVNVDGQKAFGCQGFFIKLRAEHRYGDNADADAGTLLSPELITDLPFRDSDQVALTDVLFTQALSENFALFAGKLDTLDGDPNAYASGRGKTQFSNTAMVINPTLLRVVPYSTLGTGFIILEDMQPIFMFSLLNGVDTTGTSGFEDLFGDGAALTAQLRLPTTFFGLPGHQLIGGAWNSHDYVSLGQDPRILLPDVPIARTSDTWGLYYNFDQALIVDPCNAQRNWGVFGRVGVADDRVSPAESFFSFGFGGASPFGARPADTFGVGWYDAITSDKIGPIISTIYGPIGDGQAVELFYNYEVTPYCHVTPDLQVLVPARENVNTSLFLGLRVKVDL
ncbi:MAG TPA: carbohydrate porin [Pirellulales bacterium]|jgi:porin|nr:carbohydrate porin [Pirellulales bacterium]